MDEVTQEQQVDTHTIVACKNINTVVKASVCSWIVLRLINDVIKGGFYQPSMRYTDPYTGQKFQLEARLYSWRNMHHRS